MRALSLILLAAACGTEPETGTLVVSTRLSGIDIQFEHTITVDEMPPKAIPADGSRELVLSAGNHLVRIHGVASNCVSSVPEVQPVSIHAGEASNLDYTISCTPNTGFIRVGTTTTGEDIDPDGYFASTTPPEAWLGGGGWIGANGEVVLGPTAIGERTVWLSDLAKNCSVSGGNPVPVTVTKGRGKHDTVTVSMQVTCAPRVP